MVPKDCEGKIGGFLIGTADGGLVPFDGIREMDGGTICEGGYDPCVGELFQEEMSMEVKLTHRSARRFRKAVHAAVNRERRLRRRIIRNTEWARRMELKKGGRK